MASDNDDLRNISDTARWVAIYRAIESERPDALFHDPFARRLAGERGERIAETMEFANRHAWSFVARTVVFDRLIEDSIASGADMVVNLAAGLDTRPYRMALPSNLPWIEVDLPDLLAYKIAVLANPALPAGARRPRSRQRGREARPVQPFESGREPRAGDHRRAARVPV